MLITSPISVQVSHHRQYPPNTTVVYSYFESRGHQKRGYPETCFFGLQYLIKRYLLGPVVTQERIDEAREVSAVAIECICFISSNCFRLSVATSKIENIELLNIVKVFMQSVLYYILVLHHALEIRLTRHSNILYRLL